MILCFGLQIDSVLKLVDLLSSPEMSFQSPDLYRDRDESPSETMDYDRIRPQHDLTPRPINYDQCVYFDDIKPRLPIFSGEVNLWEPFLMQLRLISRSYGWNDAQFRSQLMLALKGEALLYVSSLPLPIRENTTGLLHSMEQRFGQCVFPETHRTNLYNIQQQPTENLQQYSARISQLMMKAFPGMQSTKIYDSLAIEYFLRGLTDQKIAYEVFTKRPRDLSKAVEMVAWHEVCSKLVHQTVVHKTEPQHSHKTSRKQNRICYNCRKKGHEANLCPAEKTYSNLRRGQVPKPTRH